MWYYDLAFIGYALMVLVGTWGFLLFLSWLVKMKFRGSAMYWYVMLMFLGSGIMGLVMMQARYICLTRIEDFPLWSEGWYWPGRLALVLVIQFAIVIHMTWRTLRGHRDGDIKRTD